MARLAAVTVAPLASERVTATITGPNDAGASKAWIGPASSMVDASPMSPAGTPSLG